MKFTHTVASLVWSVPMTAFKRDVKEVAGNGMKILRGIRQCLLGKEHSLRRSRGRSRAKRFQPDVEEN